MKKYLILFIGLLFADHKATARDRILFVPEDTVIFKQILKHATENKNTIHIARYFIGTPYSAGTLEGDQEERLRINLRALDCFTFVENVIAFHLLLHTNDWSFDHFCALLENIRYRNGIMNGYLSRLHYATEWLDNNRQKGILSLPLLKICIPFSPNVSYMSSHCEQYPALKKNKEWCSEMAYYENEINDITFCYIPKEEVKHAYEMIRDGDIIAITTNIEGLDISHLGFAVTGRDTVFILHASSVAKKVIMNEPLHDYLSRHKNHSGIIISRIIQ